MNIVLRSSVVLKVYGYWVEYSTELRSLHCMSGEAHGHIHCIVHDERGPSTEHCSEGIF